MAQVKILDILWLQNSPFGGYVAGDTIAVYYNTDIVVLGEVLSTTLNGALHTPGSTYSIPPTFFYAGNDQNYYKQETTDYPLICTISNERIEFFRINYWPFLSYRVLPNSPFCSTSGFVCDLAFDGFPQVIPATGPTIADGQITVQATSTYPIQYKKSSNFVYDDGTAQTSGTFFNLTPGTYTIFARDSKNCSAQIQIDVGYDESFGVLYTGNYYDRLGNVSKIEILKRAYSGSSTEITFGSNPLQFSLRGEGSEDIYKPILSTEVMVNLKATAFGMFSDLYTNNPERFRVRWSKNINDAGFVTLWQGKLLPNQFNEPLATVPYDFNITATDDLTQLKEIFFVQGEVPVTNVFFLNLRFTGRVKQIKLLAEVLKKLRLGYNIRVACNLYATGMNQAATDDPFDQAYVNTDLYYTNQEKIPTFDFVLTSLLEPYGCRLLLWQDTWHVVRVDELVDAYDYREFNSNGDYVSNGVTNPLLSIKGATKTNRFVWRDQSQTANVIPGYGTIYVKYQLGFYNNILRNGDFRLKSEFNPLLNSYTKVPDLYAWQLVANGEQPNLSFEGLTGINIAIKLSNATGESYLISDPVTVKNQGFEKLHFKIKYKLPNQSISLKYQKVKVRINYGSWYLKADGTWTNSVNEFAFYQSTYGQYVESEIIARPLSEFTFTTSASLQVRVYHSYALDAEFTSLASLKAKTTTTLLAGTKTEYHLSFTMRFYELENNTSAADDVNIVRPNDYHATTNPYQWILKTQQASPDAFGSEFFIDTISLGVLSGSGSIPSTEKTSIFFGEQNNRNKLETEVYMGSFVQNVLITETFPNAQLVYTGFLTNAAGTEFTTWKRDTISESKLLHDIQLSQLSAQYGLARKRLTGTLYSDDTYLTPLNCLIDTMDESKKYVLLSMVLDDRTNTSQVELIEKAVVTDSSTPGYGFSIGFSLGYNA